MEAAFSWANVHWPALAIGITLLLAALSLRRLTNEQVQAPAARLAIGLPGLALAAWALSQGMAGPEKPPLQPLTVAVCLKTLGAPETDAVPPLVPWETAQAAQAAATSAAIAASAVPLPSTSIGLMGGQGTGTYAQFAVAIAEAASAAGVVVVPLTSTGTVSNLKTMLTKANAGFGFAQADVRAGLSDQDKLAAQVSTLRLVLPLYPEELQVLARQPLRGWADLAGRRVVSSATSEGSRLTAGNLLRHFSVKPASAVEAISPFRGLCEVLADDGQADAMVAVGGKPLSFLADLDKLRSHPTQPLSRVGFLSVPMPDTQQDDTKTYEAAKLVSADYSWLPEAAEVDTVSVRALLMAYDFSTRNTPFMKMRCDQLQRVVAALRANEKRLRQPPNHPAWRRVDMSREVNGWQWDACANPGGKPPRQSP